MKETHDIYDRIAKRCLTLSTRCTINLINGLYGTDYPVDSKVTYHWTEHTDHELKRTLADTIITINDQHSYHIEFQMTKDGDIILRMLEYGFSHALKNTDMDTLCFPEPLVIYLYNKEHLPDEYSIRIRFGEQAEHIYKVPVYKYLEKSLEELNSKKLIILIPFQLLKLRQAIEKQRTKENMHALKNLITHDIMDSLTRNVEAGNITETECMKLRSMILHLYRHIYGNYEELNQEGVNQMAEEALIFDIDILDYKIRKLEESFEALEAKKQSLESKNQSLESENQSLESENQSLESKNQSLEAENQSLESKNQSLESENQSLESENQSLESKNQSLESKNQSLESKNQSLESKNQSLESKNQSLESENEIWKLFARGFSPEIISEKTGVSLEFVRNILDSE